jgi:hypothetical protein
MIATTQTPSKKLCSLIFSITVIGTILFWIYFASSPASSSSPLLQLEQLVSATPLDHSGAGVFIDPIAKYFADYTFDGPNYGDHFGELGQRVQILTKWMALSQARGNDSLLDQSIEQASLAMFPFIRNPTNPQDATPLTRLRNSYIPNVPGIVIPVGGNSFRYACHLVLSIRNVLHSTLPIQIAYAGDEDLSPTNREILSSLVQDIDFLDVLSVLDNESMGLDRSWAIKPFAALASKFEQVILIDADAVFLQPPEYLFSQRGYQETGTLLFHDRLLWQHAYPERHEWWKKQMRHQEPSEALLKSLVWTEDYAEEGDSGVVVLHKGKLAVFMALLHICWQNTKAVREDTTYKMTYGDKESWWFGLELCGVPHVFEKHYGAVIGDTRVQGERTGVCGFTIAHVDEKDRLIWYNGSLLKNKAVDKTTFEVADHWMIDAMWEKGETKSDMSCMTGGTVRDVTEEEKAILKKMVELAKKVDREKELT